MSLEKKYKAYAKKKKKTKDEGEEQTLFEEHRDPKKFNYSNTCSHIGVRFNSKWREIYRVFKDE